MASTKLKKVTEQFSAYRKNAAARLKAVKSTGAAKSGRAAVSGVVAGAIDHYAAIDLAGRSIPFALPIGLAGALFGKGMVAEAGADMVAAGAALFTQGELQRMNVAGRAR